jgi:formylmethanofuran dehydrogenase subunit E-like metal-binding protein
MKGKARQATDDNITRRMRLAWWITKATETHSESVITIVFPLQQWLRERASMLLYKHFADLVTIFRQ